MKLSLLLLALFCLSRLQAQVDRSLERNRFPSSGQFSLFLGNATGVKTPIAIKTALPSALHASVAESNPAVGATAKHVTNIRWEPLLFRPAFPLDKTLLEHLNGTIGTTAMPPSISGDLTARYSAELVRQQSFNGIITELFFPGADAAQRDVRQLTVTITPEQLRQTDGVPQAPQQPLARDEAWMAANFSFTIRGLEKLRVLRIDTFSIRRPLAFEQVGISREPTKAAGKLLLPNLRITVGRENAADVLQWERSWFVDGKHSNQDERSATLTLLSAARDKKLLEMVFENVGLVRSAMTPEGFQLELYVEKVSLVSSQ